MSRVSDIKINRCMAYGLLTIVSCLIVGQFASSRRPTPTNTTITRIAADQIMYFRRGRYFANDLSCMGCLWVRLGWLGTKSLTSSPKNASVSRTLLDRSRSVSLFILWVCNVLPENKKKKERFSRFLSFYFYQVKAYSACFKLFFCFFLFLLCMFVTCKVRNVMMYIIPLW